MSNPAPRWRTVLGVWVRLGRYVRPQSRRLVTAGLMSLVAVAFELAKPWPLKVVIDRVLLGSTAVAGNPLGSASSTLLWWAIGATVLLAAGGGLAAYFRELWLAEAGQRAVNAVRRDALAAVLRQSLSWHERHRTGDLLVRLCGDAQSLRILLIEGVFSLGREGLILVGTLGVMAWVDWRMTLATIIALPAVAVLSALFSVRLRGAARKQRKKEGALATSAHETLASVPVIQAYGLADVAIESFSAQNRRSARAGRQATRREGRLGAATDIALALGTAFVLWLGVARVQAGALTPGELIVLLAYVRSFYRPIRKGLGRSAAMIKAAASGERVLELLDAVPDLVDPLHPREPGPSRGQVDLRGVRFSHDGRQEVLAGIDLHLRPGEHVAIVGGNGAGKSTLATLLARLRDPSHGTVELDGVPLVHLRIEDVRRRVAMVFQEAVLFEGTLRENIRLGRPDADPDAIEDAARRAGVLTLAERLPAGLDTPIGPRGGDLSGGERQRVALARALLRDASVYVFDEPTTGLDATAELRLRDEILPALAGRTVVIITHDLKLLDSVHRVIRLERGRIVSEECAHAPFVLLDGTGGRR